MKELGVAGRKWLAGRESHESFLVRWPPFTIVCEVVQILPVSPNAVIASAFFRLPTLADLTGAMSLKMSLVAIVSRDPSFEACVEALC